MVSCERCLEMAQIAAHESGLEQIEEYRRLVLINDCTPEQQAGRYATLCPKCEAKTVHQYTHQCIACGWKEA